MGGYYGPAEYAADSAEIEEQRKAGIAIPYVKWSCNGVTIKTELNPRGDQSTQELERFKAGKK